MAVIDRSNRSSQANQSLHARIGAGCAQTDGSSKRESCENYRTAILIFQPIECSTNIFHFSDSMIMLPLTQACAAKVEAEHRKSKAVQSFHRVKHNFIVEGSAIKRMRMANKCGMRGVLHPNVEQSFEFPCRAVQKERFDAAAGRGHQTRLHDPPQSTARP